MEGKALGKGLSALIPEKERTESATVAYLKISQVIDNSLQPRTNYDDEKLEELTASIKEKGVLQPVLVREKQGKYEIVAGERRLKAARSLNLEEIPAIIKNVSDREALVLALVENIQREELNPIEEAEAYRKLISDFELTQESVAKSVGKDRSTISNFIRLLKLPERIQKSIYEGKISTGHARALLGVESAPLQDELFEHVIKKGLSVRELENLISTPAKGRARREKVKKQKGFEILALEEALQKSLGTKVRVEASKKRGKIIVEYYSMDDLKRIINVIKS